MFPLGMLAVTFQLPGLVACSVCDQPEIAFHTSCPTVVVVPAVWLIAASLYGPQLPLAADVTQLAPEPDEELEPEEPDPDEVAAGDEVAAAEADEAVLLDDDGLAEGAADPDVAGAE